MIDTHVHLNHADLHADLAGVLERAAAANVTGFLVVGYDLRSSALALDLAAQDERIRAVVGIHPHDAARWNPQAAAQVRSLAKREGVAAIGEIGLDFYRDLSPRDAQYAAFRAQLALAHDLRLPIVIHCRDAYDETMALLEAEAPEDTPIILHCFAGTRAHAERAWARGWFLGVGGTVTYKKNDDLREIVRAAPQDSLLLETDAPYLSPEPLRGKFPNEPGRVPLVAAKIAEVRDESIADVDAYTTANAARAFG